MKKRWLIVALLALLAGLPALDAPRLQGRVNDLAGLLDMETRDRMEMLLADLEERTAGAQLAVLTLNSLEGEELSDFSYRVASAWKLGQEGQDNGALLLVALAERKVRIEVGYGLEERLTDAKSSLIINREIIPRFKKGEYAAGIEAGVGVMVDVVSGDNDITEEELRRYREKKEKEKKGGIPVGLIIAFWILVFILRGRGGRGSGTFWSGGIGGGFSGGGGGGFSGFSGGGGSFGGGGASGSW